MASIHPITIAAGLALALGGCAETAPEPAATDGRPVSIQRLDGLYTTRIDARRHVPGGTWAMRIDITNRRLRLIPPTGGEITLRLTAIDDSSLQLAPDPACESHVGRTRSSSLKWRRTGNFLRLRTLSEPCRSNAAVLTAAPWRAAWPTTDPITSGLGPADKPATMQHPGSLTPDSLPTSDRSGWPRRRPRGQHVPPAGVRAHQQPSWIDPFGAYRSMTANPGTDLKLRQTRRADAIETAGPLPARSSRAADGCP